MSNTIRLSSKLPGDPETNGLDARRDHFIHDGETPIACIAWVVATKVTRDLATGEEVPTVEVRRIEPIGSPSAVPQMIQDLAAELYEKRTGRDPLPFAELISPAGDIGELRPIDGDVAEFMGRRPGPGAEVFVFEGRDGDE